MINKEKIFNGNTLPLLALFIANGVSMTGNMLSTISIPWFVLQTTGSATQMGLVGFFTVIPIVLAGLLGGVLVDRVGFKKTSIIADLSSGVTVIFIPLFYLTVGLPFWSLLILVFFALCWMHQGVRLVLPCSRNCLKRPECHWSVRARLIM
jgi:MFS family permease